MPIKLNGHRPQILRKIFSYNNSSGLEKRGGYNNNNINEENYYEYDHNDDYDLRHIDPTKTLSTSISNESDWKIHAHITIIGKSMGNGSSGIAYQAFYDTGDMIEKCVVKLPIALMEKGLLKIDGDNGGLHISPLLSSLSPSLSRSSREKNEQISAVQNFVGEWKNSFLLHFGRHMSDLGMDKYKWKIKRQEFRQIQGEKIELSHKRGYENIHRLLVFDESIPLIISEYFDGTLQNLSNILAKSSTQLRTDFMFDCIIPQTYAGLLFMHSDEIDLAHMDIKPMNMLYRFAPGHKYPQVVLCDFGLCQPATSRSNNKCGTEVFLAPEILNDLYVPKYTDVHSWAISMLWCFNSQKMQENDNNSDNNDDGGGGGDMDWSGSLIQILLKAEYNSGQQRISLTQKQKIIWEKVLTILQENVIRDPPRRYSTFLDIDKDLS